MSDQAPAVLYAAKSTEDRKGSIPTQLEDGRALAAREGLEVAAEFQDEAYSAFHGDRGPGLAEAIAKCEELVQIHGEATLIVQHSDRLARGDAKHAKHLIEYTLWGIKSGVRIRSVQDPDMFPEGEYGLLMSAVGGMRNNEDSKRKSKAVQDGLRRSAERGDAAWLARGIKLDGYKVTARVNGRGEKVHTAIKDPERRAIFELIWLMALEGRSLPTIQLELSARGYRTRPSRKDHRAGPFTVNRISQVLENPAYAGLVVHRGEVVGPGKWEPYVSVEDFYRQLEARRTSPATQARMKRGKGRPPAAYLLSGLATCGICGGRMQARSSQKRGKDGTIYRGYRCAAHYQYHRDSQEWCSVETVNATEVDALVLAGIDKLLADADALRAQIEAGRAAAIERQGKVAEDARKEATRADAAVKKAQARYESALATDDGTAAEIALTAVRNLREKADKARKLMNAALDALHADEQPEDADVLATVWRVLSGRVDDAEGDVKKLNMALREVFEAFDIRQTTTGVMVVPVISVDALARMIGTPDAFTSGNVRAVAYDSDGNQTHLWGEALRGSTSFMRPEGENGDGENGPDRKALENGGCENVVDVAEHNRASVACDQVQFTEAGAEVAIQDLQSEAREVFGRELLTDRSQFDPSLISHAGEPRRSPVTQT